MFASADAVQICGKFWDTQYLNSWHETIFLSNTYKNVDITEDEIKFEILTQKGDNEVTGNLSQKMVASWAQTKLVIKVMNEWL